MARIVLAQVNANGNKEDNLQTARRLTLRAKLELGAELIVFPENFMSHHPLDIGPDLQRAEAEPLDGPFVTAMRALAREAGIWMIFGARESSGIVGDTRCRNCIVLVDDKGELRADYRKTHLYDAFGNKESNDVIAGDRLFTPVDTPFGRLGIFVCYELRFPEIARYEAMKGAEILIVPAAWVKGPRKQYHFRTLAAARALENTVFLLTCNMSGKDCTGGSAAYDPLGEVIAEAGEGEALVVCDIDLGRIAEVRRRLPSMKDRRPELYMD